MLCLSREKGIGRIRSLSNHYVGLFCEWDNLANCPTITCCRNPPVMVGQFAKLSHSQLQTVYNVDPLLIPTTNHAEN
jgi:hypothetical protein